MNQIFKRLYIFTGKGGVGKTTLSLSFAQHLKNQGKKVKLVYFKTSKLDETPSHNNEYHRFAQELDLTIEGLELLPTCETYIGMKLKSKTIARWIIKTPFFKSLMSMIPGFNYTIYLGQILQNLEQDPELIIILDSPSSGHALTMIEATKNFRDIFGAGALFNDTQKMLKMLNTTHFTQMNIITLPNIMAINEAVEFKQSLEQIIPLENYIFCNNTLISYLDPEMPEFLRTKIANETESINGSSQAIKAQIPYSMTDSSYYLVKDLAASMENLV